MGFFLRLDWGIGSLWVLHWFDWRHHDIGQSRPLCLNRVWRIFFAVQIRIDSLSFLFALSTQTNWLSRRETIVQKITLGGR